MSIRYTGLAATGTYLLVSQPTSRAVVSTAAICMNALCEPSDVCPVARPRSPLYEYNLCTLELQLFAHMHVRQISLSDQVHQISTTE